MNIKYIYLYTLCRLEYVRLYICILTLVSKMYLQNTSFKHLIMIYYDLKLVFYI